MSFLAARVAASEGAYFNETSKHAIARLREKAAANKTPLPPSSSSSSALEEAAIAASVLPEILQHSLLPLPRACLQADLQHYSLPSHFSPSPSSLAASLSSTAPPPRLPPHARHVNLDTAGLYAFLPNLPQASFGPRRWTPVHEEIKIVASTANLARMEGFSSMDDSRVKALVEGYSVVMRAFFIATALVVGGSSIAVGAIASEAHIHSLEDIRIKGHELIQPWAKAIDQGLEPWKQWVHQQGVGWRMGDHVRSDASDRFAKVMGLRTAPIKDEAKRNGGASKGN